MHHSGDRRTAEEEGGKLATEHLEKGRGVRHGTVGIKHSQLVEDRVGSLRQNWMSKSNTWRLFHC